MYQTLVKIPLVRELAKTYAHVRAPIYFISFPKCGRTWVRVMLGKFLREHFNDWEHNLLDLVEPKHRRPGFPGLKWVHDDAVHWKKPNELSEDKANYRYKRVILLVRDPLDAIVSLYFEKHKRLKSYFRTEAKQYREVEERIRPFDGDISSFLKQKVGGFETILRFYNIWERQREVPDDFLLVRYEDLHRDPRAELRRIVEFIGLEEVQEELIDEAVDFAGFQRMRAMEQHDVFQSASLRPTDENDPESFKTRKGRVGGYVEYLTPEQINTLTRRMKSVLNGTFGYGGAS